MQSHGRIVIIVMSLCVQLLGGVVASVDNTKVSQGETVSFTLDMIGEIAEIPTLESICDTAITGMSKDTHVFSEKGSFKKSTRMSYEFLPMRDCTVAPIRVMVDGILETTQPIAIKVIPMEVTAESPFILSMVTTRERCFVGEPFEVDIVFSQKRKSGSVDSKFQLPALKDVWIKEELEAEVYEEGERRITKRSFIMAAQKSGPLEISPAQIKIATRSRARDAQGQWVPGLKWHTLFSNSLALEVLPLPSAITLVGDLNISANVDTQQIKANKAVTLIVRIEGSGNFEDLDALEVKIDDVMVYEEAGTIETVHEDGVYTGSWTQRFTFVSDSSFLIPSFEIRYFDPLKREVYYKQTEPILITVEEERPKSADPLKITRPDQVIVEDDDALSGTFSWLPFTVIGAVGGFLTALLSLSLPWKRWREALKEIFSPSQTGDYRHELQILVNHLDDDEAKEMVMRIEGVLYEGKTVTIDKKELKRLMKRLQSVKRG